MTTSLLTRKEKLNSLIFHNQTRIRLGLGIVGGVLLIANGNPETHQQFIIAALSAALLAAAILFPTIHR